jgi:hypothetical protein
MKSCRNDRGRDLVKKNYPFRKKREREVRRREKRLIGGFIQL